MQCVHLGQSASEPFSNISKWCSSNVIVPICRAEHPEVAPVAVPALAQLFRGWPGQASAVNQKAQQSPGTEAGVGPASLATDAAALQLEALQVLLLLFPLPVSQVSLCTQVMLAGAACTNAACLALFPAVHHCTHFGAYGLSGCVPQMLAHL